MSSGIFENMRLIKMNVFYKFIRLFKIFFCFHRESHDHIRCKRRCRIIFTDQFTFFCIFLCTVATIHIFQGFVATALKRQMEMRANFSCRNDSFQKFFGNDPRFKRAQTDSLNSFYFTYRLDQGKKALSFFFRKIHAVGT